MEPWFLLPALEELGENVQMLLIATGDDPATAELRGVFPLRAATHLAGVPVPHVALWRHPLMLLGTPLVDRRDGYAALDLVLRTIGRRWSGAGLAFDNLGADGPVARWLDGIANRRRWRIERFNPFERAVLVPKYESDEHLRSVMKRKRRKEIQRLRRRLEEVGRVESTRHRDGSGLKDAVTRFLELELDSWKGREGTAIRSAKAPSRCLERVFDAGQAEGRVEVLELRLDGRVIASKVNLLSHPEAGAAFAFKIVYDEAWAQYSPGVQLELDNLDWAYQHPHVRWMDSCANADHPMIDRLWLDRRPIETRVVGTGALHSRLLMASLAAARVARQHWRER